MTLIKFPKDYQGRPTNAFPTLSHYFGDLFENVALNDSKKWTIPSVNIIERENEFVLELAAPGLAKEDFKINVENNTLRISGEKKLQENENKENFTRKEFFFGSFSRSFNIPETIDIETIKAEYTNGIMKVNLPKKIESKSSLKEVKIH